VVLALASVTVLGLLMPVAVPVPIAVITAAAAAVAVAETAGAAAAAAVAAAAAAAAVLAPPSAAPVPACARSSCNSYLTRVPFFLLGFCCLHRYGTKATQWCPPLCVVGVKAGTGEAHSPSKVVLSPIIPLG